MKNLSRISENEKQIYKTGFTLIELLVIIAISSILAGLLLPILSKTKTNSIDLRCMDNGKQLIMALHLYASEFNEMLPPNEDNNTQYDGWVAGDMWQPNQATNTVFLTDPRYAKLARYTSPDASLYRCPADNSVVTIGNTKIPRTRSVSMNQACGTKRNGHSPVEGAWLSEGVYGRNKSKVGLYRTYGKLSSIIQPTPSKLWIFIDEDEYSINDGGFAFTMYSNPASTEWIDRPASYHQMGCGLSFADGHAEVHSWVDPRTRLKDGNLSRATQPNNPDILWMIERTSAKVKQ